MDKQMLVKNSKKIMLALAVIALVIAVAFGAFIGYRALQEEKPTMKITVLDVSDLGENNNEEIADLAEEGKEGESQEGSTTEVKQINGKQGEKSYAKAELNGKVYINNTNTVTLQLEGTDESKYKANTLTAEKIIVKVGGSVVSPKTKTLSAATTITNGVRYELTLKGIPGDGELSVTVNADTLEDEATNKNIEVSTTFDKKIIIDNTKPTIKFGNNGSTTYQKTNKTSVTVTDTPADSASGVNASSLKYQWTQSKTAPEESTFKTEFVSGKDISTPIGVTGDNWYLWILAKDNVGNTIITNSNVFYIDNKDPELTLNKETYQEGFDGWTLPAGASVDSSGILTMTQNGQATSKYYRTGNEPWYISLDFYTETTAQSQGTKGGVYVSTTYHDSNLKSTTVKNGNDHNVWQAPGNLKTWVTQSRIEFDGNYGGTLEYLKASITTGNEYSQSPIKVRNFKLHGQLYSSFYDITVTRSDANSDVKVVKYAKGNQSKEYFATAGTELTENSFRVTENGTYTVYVEDNSGNSVVKTIEITKIDKTQPTVSAATKAQYGSDVSVTIKDDLSGVVGWQITGSNTAPTSGWKEIPATTNSTITAKKADGLSVGKKYIWVMDAAGNKKSTEITVYYKVTYTKEEHITAIGSSGEENTTGSIKLPTITQDDGYTVLGWYNGTTKFGNPGDTKTISDNITLTAKVRPNIMTIKYHADGGKNNGTTAMSDPMRTDKINYDGTDWAGTNGGPNYLSGTWNLKKTGYVGSSYWRVGSTTSTTKLNADKVFAKNQDIANEIGKLEDFKKGDITVDLYPEWTAQKLTITYHKNDGSGATSSETITWDGNMDDNKFAPKTELKTRAGYTFKGWSLKTDGTDNVRFEFNGTVGTTWFLEQVGTSATKSINLYAIWADETKPVISTATPSTNWDLTNYVDITATDEGSKIVGYNITTSTTPPTTWIPVVDGVEAQTETKYDKDAAWARVFHHNNHWGDIYFTNANEVKSSNTIDKYSVLTNLEKYKGSSNKFEFLLEYPSVSKTDYNRWTQTVNPVTAAAGSNIGYTAGHIAWSGSNWGGLALSSSTSNTFIDGSPSAGTWYFALGVYSNYQGSMPGPNTSIASTVNLWARVDDKATVPTASITRRIGNLTENKKYYVWVKDNVGNTQYKDVTVSKVDTTAPTASISSTNGVAASQTVTLTMSDNVAVAKYYWGTSNPQKAAVTWTNYSKASESVTVNSEGTYYFGVKDTVGNITVVSKTFYKTTFTPNKGGTVNPTSVITLSGNNFKLPAPTAAAGYTFDAWYTAASGGQKVGIAGATYTPTGNTTLHGQWNKITYTIKYTLNGGSITGQPTSYDVETADFTLPTPTKSGWTFTGWSGTGLSGSTNKNVTVKKGSTGERSYEAHWSKAITLTQKHGKTTTTQNYTMKDSETSHTFTLVTSQDTFEGWTFEGWLDAGTPKKPDYGKTDTITISDNKTVYATYSKVLTATFTYYNGTTKQTTKVTGTAYGNNQCGGVANQYPTIKSPTVGTYTGYGIVGWIEGTGVSSKATVASGANITGFSANKTYYGLYSKTITATLKIYNNKDATPKTGILYESASGAVQNASIDLGTTTAANGYNFRGWSIGTGAKDEVVKSPVSLNANKTYYANYELSRTATFYYWNGTKIASATDEQKRYMNYTGAFVETDYTLPAAVSGSSGKHGGTYKGIANAASTMSTVSKPTTANVTYYAVYSRSVTIYRPTSASKVEAMTAYRNEYFTGASAITAKLASSASGTTDISGITNIYGSLAGFNTTANKNENTHADIAALRDSNATTVYARSTHAENATIYYNNDKTSGNLKATTATAATTSTYYCNNTTTTAVAHGTTSTVPEAVSASVGKYNSAYAGVANVNSMTKVTSFSGGSTYYAIYSSPLTIYYQNTSSTPAISSNKSALYRNEYFTNASTMATITSNKNNDKNQATTVTISNLRGTFKGVNATVDKTAYDTVNSDNVKNSSTTTYYAVATASENATFYYNSNSTSGSFEAATATSPTTVTYYCKSTSVVGVSHGTTSTVPAAVSSSVGKYNSTYFGVSGSLSSMTKTTTFTGGSKYYAIYSSAVTIYYPSSTSARSSYSYYRNEYFSSASAMDTVIATSQTGTGNFTFTPSVTGYSLVGFASTAGTNTIISGVTTVAKLATNASTTVYAVLSKSVTAKFYYSNNATTGVTSASATAANQYIRCTTTAAEINNSTVTPPSISQTAPYGTTFLGWATTTSTMTTTSTYNTGTAAYYAVYRVAVDIYYPTTTSTVAVYKYYRNVFLTNTTTKKAVIASTQTGTTDFTFKSSVDGYGLYGFATAQGTTTISYGTVAELATSTTTTAYTILSKSITATFYYSSSASGAAKSTKAAAANMYLCSQKDSVHTSGSSITIPSVTHTEPYGTTFKGWASSVNTISTTTNPTTYYTEYYAVYTSNVTIYRPNTEGTGTNSVTKDTFYRNAYFTTPNPSTIKTILVTIPNGVGSGSVTPTLVSNYSFNSLTTGAKGTGTSYSSVEDAAKSANTTFYLTETRSISATFYYYNGSAKASENNSGTRTLDCSSTTVARIQNGTIGVPAKVSTVFSNTVGWSYVGVNTDTTANGTVITPTTANTTYYAKYKRTVTLVYNKNGGTGTVANQTTTQHYNAYGNIETIKFTLSTNNFTRTYYTFQGWAESATSTSTKAVGSSYSIAPGVAASATVTLYACWKDTSAPSLTGSAIANIDSSNQLTFTLTITKSSDSGDGLSGYRVYNGNTALGTLKSSTATSGNVSITLSSNTNWYTSDLVVKAVDKAGNVSGGIGISYYTVSTADGIKGLAAAVNAGGTFTGRTVNQTAKIAPTSVTAVDPIGSRNKPFKGTFDGQSKGIENISFNASTSIPDIALFGGATDATIRNVTIKMVALNSSLEYSSVNAPRMGGIVGTATGNTRITSCTVSGAITTVIKSSQDNTCHVAGICGFANGNTIIESCTNSAKITGTKKGEVVALMPRTGGITGTMSATAQIKSCNNNGQIIGNYITGGISAYAVGTISGCNNTGSVSNNVEYSTADYTDGIGGIAGKVQSTGTVTACVNSGAVTGNLVNKQGSAAVGGIAGRNTGGNVNFVKNTGNIEGKKGAGIGGMVGVNVAGTVYGGYGGFSSIQAIINCGVNTGTVKGNGKNTGDTSASEENGTSVNLGGICGQNLGGTVTNFVNEGSVTAGSSAGTHTGGIVGSNVAFDADKQIGYESYTSDLQADISKCSNRGEVSGTQQVGGIAGLNFKGSSGKNANIEECSNTKEISTTGDYAGGLAGYNNGGSISLSYNAASVVSDSTYRGGITGRNYTGSTIRYCYSSQFAVSKSGSPFYWITSSNSGSISDTYYINYNAPNANSVGTAKDDGYLKTLPGRSRF